MKACRARPELHDEIQEAVIAKARELGWPAEVSTYQLAARSNGLVSADHLHNFLMRRSSMGSHKLQHVLKVLGLRVTPVS